MSLVPACATVPIFAAPSVGFWGAEVMLSGTPCVRALSISSAVFPLQPQPPGWPSGERDTWGGGQVTAGLGCPTHTRGQQ